eukprot:1137220-Pelagomonas_calceolata.AAC.2
MVQAETAKLISIAISLQPNYQNLMNHQRARIICRSNWTLSVRPLPGTGLSNSTSKSVLSEPIPPGADPWAWDTETHKLVLCYRTKLVPNNIAYCTAQPSRLKSPDKKAFAWQACQVSGPGVRWAGHAGHLLLSCQLKKFHNTLPMASSSAP